MNRRHFLAGVSACAVSAGPILAAAGTADLIAAAGSIPLVPGDYPETEIWGFNGGVPGPEIRVGQGARVTQRLRNDLPQPTSIHWHGLRIPNAMDGVPGLTQEAVAPGQDFTYDFVPPDAGTYWYHSHNKSTEQVARGLYGLLIVDEATPPDVDHDISVIVDDWRLTETATIVEDFDAMHNWTHGGRLGNYVHAKLAPALSKVKRNQRLRLRLVNAATDRVMVIGLHGMEGAVVAMDGMPLTTPEKTDHAVLGPAQRVDFIVDVTAAQGEHGIIALHEREEALILSQLSVTGVGSRVPRPSVTALPGNPLAPMASADGAREARLIMEGGAMGGLSQGIYQGQKMNVQDLLDQGQIWTFNGIAGLPETPLALLERGERLRIPMRNDTVFPHAMHLHGHHFQEVLKDGTLGPLRDTLMVEGAETREIVFEASNPGDWLLHCHMLSHQAAGMKTWLRIKT